MSTSPQSRTRRPKGQPTGGEFVEEARAGSGLSLMAKQEGAGRKEQLGALQNVASRAALYGSPMDEFIGELDGELLGIDAQEYMDQFFAPAVAAHRHGRTKDANVLLARVVGLDEREASWLGDHDFTPPHVISSDDDSMYGPVRTGSKYDPRRTPTEIATNVRADIKEAQCAGYLPPEATCRVTSSQRGGGSVHLQVDGVPDHLAFNPRESTPYDDEPTLVRSAYARTITDRANLLVAQYTRQQTDSGADFFNVSTWVTTGLQSSSQAQLAPARSDYRDAHSRDDALGTYDASQRIEVATRAQREAGDELFALHAIPTDGSWEIA